MVKRSNSPGLIVPPVHVTVCTASDTVPVSVLVGGDTGAFCTAKVQPGMGSTLTSPIGWPAGNAICTWVVSALSISFGTEKVSWENPPAGASAGLTVTWAHAGAA